LSDGKKKKKVKKKNERYPGDGPDCRDSGQSPAPTKKRISVGKPLSFGTIALVMQRPGGKGMAGSALVGEGEPGIAVTEGGGRFPQLLHQGGQKKDRRKGIRGGSQNESARQRRGDLWQKWAERESHIRRKLRLNRRSEEGGDGTTP